ncbi:MAG: hypothetical protein ACOCYX_03615, partial [Spirochaetota bacterium]
MRHSSVRVIAIIALLLVAATGVLAQTDGVPRELRVDTLYDGALEGRAAHTLEIERGGDYVLFVTARSIIEVVVRVPNRPRIEHVATEGSRNFIFLDDLEPGTLELEFSLEEDDESGARPHY